MRFTYMLYAGTSQTLVGIHTALESGSDVMLRFARLYARGGNRVEVWYGTPRNGTLSHITY